MKLLSIRTINGLELGVKTAKGILNIPRALASTPAEIPATVAEVIAGGSKAMEDLAVYVSRVTEENPALLLAEEEISFGPCLPAPGKIICIGLNYHKHIQEANQQVPQYPLLFSKFSNAIAAHGENITIPKDVEKLDYEAELVLVIGKRAKNVSRGEALDHIFGYCNGNDLSARDLQFRTSQWLLGKTCDGFCPLGPYLVTADEVGSPDNLDISCRVNGEIRQQSNTSRMIFSCAELVSYISGFLTLEPGDIILSGTPEGVALGMPEEHQSWLREGDQVWVEIEKLGRLCNTLGRG